MGAKIYSVDYYHATVEDRPGEGSRFLSWLASEQVNLLAFTATPIGDSRSRLTIYPLNPIWMAHVARRKGLKLKGPEHGFIVHGDDELGALVGIHRRLADSRINVSMSNGIVDGRGGYRYLLHVDPEDFDEAMKVLDVEQHPDQFREVNVDFRRRFEALG